MASSSKRFKGHQELFFMMFTDANCRNESSPFFAVKAKVLHMSLWVNLVDCCRYCHHASFGWGFVSLGIQSLELSCPEIQSRGLVSQGTQSQGPVCLGTRSRGRVCPKTRSLGRVCPKTRNPGRVCPKIQSLGLFCPEIQSPGLVCLRILSRGHVWNSTTTRGHHRSILALAAFATASEILRLQIDNLKNF